RFMAGALFWLAIGFMGIYPRGYVSHYVATQSGVLTYMSINSKLLDTALKAETLFQLESLFTRDETARTMIVSADVLAAVTPPFPDTVDGLRRGEFRGWLDSFLEGGEISVAEDPDKKPRDAMLARVHPTGEEFWSIRV